MSQQTETASEMLRKLIEAIEKAHTSLFAQCCSNPIKNAWGKEVSVAALNDAQEMAVSFRAALRSEQPASEPVAVAELPAFPIMKFKMWGSNEVRQWIDDNIKPLVQERHFHFHCDATRAADTPASPTQTSAKSAQEPNTAELPSEDERDAVNTPSITAPSAEIVRPSEDTRDLAQVVEDAGGWGAETEQFLIAQEDKRYAERYRWLREQHWNEADMAVVCSPKKSVKLGFDCPSGQRLDDAIDAAIAKGEGK